MHAPSHTPQHTLQDMTSNFEVSAAPDYASMILHKPSKKIFSVVNNEWTFPSTQYILWLKQNKRTGEVTVTGHEPVDWSAYDGIMVSTRATAHLNSD